MLTLADIGIGIACLVLWESEVKTDPTTFGPVSRRFVAGDVYATLRAMSAYLAGAIFLR